MILHDHDRMEDTELRQTTSGTAVETLIFDSWVNFESDCTHRIN